MALGVAVVLGGAILALALTWLIWRAVGNAIDWLIITFGNEEAANEVRKRRKPALVEFRG